MKRILSFGWGALLLVGCPSPTTPTTDAASDGTVLAGDPADRACQHLAALGCAEGLAMDGGACAPVLRQALATRIVAFDVSCMTSATTKEAARACPGIVCP